MNTIDQDTQNSFMQSCSNAYKTIEDQFQNLLNENKTNTLETLSTKLSNEFKINTIFPKDKLDAIREDLPILNGVQSYEDLAKLDGKMVRYFCYVQDLLEPEMQIGALLKRDVASSTTVEEYLKEHKIKYLNYRDFYDPALFEEFDMNEDVVLFDRNNVLATPIPYQNEWFASLFQSTRTKVIPSNKEYSSIHAHLKAFFSSKTAPQGYADEEFSFGPFCLVKFYDSIDGKVSLNQVIEVTGILQYQIENLKDGNNAAKLEEGDTFINTDALYPVSLFPRLHAVDFNKLKTSDLLSKKIVTKSHDNTEQLDFAQVRDEILNLLTVITGDKKASELLLISLVSRIYMRKDLETLGKLSVNFIHADQPVKVLREDGQEVQKQSVAELINAVIRRLLPFSVRLDIDIKNLNNITLQPKKDHNLNCLTRGKLQMANDTLLLLDETHLDVGTLGEKGVKNLQALNSLIQNQTLMYDFVYYESPLNTDVKPLILSKGKSILTSDIQKKLPECERSIKESDALCDILFKDDNAKWPLYRRYFLECFNKVEVIEITKEIAKVIESDYVTECKGNNKMKAELLNQRLTIARYLAALEGRSEFDFILYNRAKEHDI